MSANMKHIILLFILGFIGVLSALPLIPQLLALQPAPPPLSIEIIQVISVAQSSVLLLLMVWLGSVFSPKARLTSPVISAIIRSEDAIAALKPQILPALIGGIIGGVFIVIFLGILSGSLPADFLSAGEKLKLPWYTRILYGGITEELLIRWGLMSFIAWGAYRITQKNGADIAPHNYVLAIIISSLIFGLGHLPVASALTTTLTAPLITYIILGNAAFGIIAGYLYWKRGLECAMGAHMIAHLTMMMGEGFM